MGQNLLQRLIAQYDLIFFNAKIALEHKKRKQKKTQETFVSWSCYWIFLPWGKSWKVHRWKPFRCIYHSRRSGDRALHLIKWQQKALLKIQEIPYKANTLWLPGCMSSAAVRSPPLCTFRTQLPPVLSSLLCLVLLWAGELDTVQRCLLTTAPY